MGGRRFAGKSIRWFFFIAVGLPLGGWLHSQQESYRMLPQEVRRPRHIAFTADNRSIIVSNSESMALVSLGGFLTSTFVMEAGRTLPVRGTPFLLSNAGGSLNIISTTDRKFSIVKSVPMDVFGLASSGDGSAFAVAMNREELPDSLLILDTELNIRQSIQQEGLGSFALNRDGSIVATGGDGVIRVWNDKSALLTTVVVDGILGELGIASGNDKIFFTSEIKTPDDSYRHVLWQIENNGTGLKKIFETGYGQGIRSMALSADGSRLVIGIAGWGSDDPVRRSDPRFGRSEVKIFDTNGNFIAGDFNGVYGNIDEVAISSDGQYAACLNEYGTIWTLSATGGVYAQAMALTIANLKSIPDDVERYLGSEVSASYPFTLPERSFKLADMFRSMPNMDIRITDIEGRRPRKYLVNIGHGTGFDQAVLFNDGFTMAASNFDENILFLDLRTATIKRSAAHRSESLTTRLRHCRMTDELISWHTDSTIMRWRKDGTRSRTLKFSRPVSVTDISLRGDRIAYMSDGSSYVVDTAGTPIHHFPGITSLVFSPDGRHYAGLNHSGGVALLDDKGKTIHTFDAGNQTVLELRFSNDGKLVIGLLGESQDGRIRMWSASTFQFADFLSAEKSRDWVIYTPDGYFDASKRGGEMIGFTRGTEGWRVDQFAMRYNRPDVILQKLGIGTPDELALYERQYRRRLTKTGLTQAQIEGELHVPEIRIVSSSQKDKKGVIECEAFDELVDLVSYNVYVNDVALFSSEKPLQGRRAPIREEIELNSGDNKIEISCRNEHQAESYRASVVMRYTAPVKQNLYVLAFGVSKYKNPDLNLVFADKDAVDIANLFIQSKGKEYGTFNEVFTRVYVNEQVTRATMDGAKDFLKNAGVDDTFILFIAGHGMHDATADATYYYLTHETDLGNLSSTAADFAQIESLLTGIAPRKKIFFMDTCESGEQDEEPVVAATGSAELVSRGFRNKNPIANTGSPTSAAQLRLLRKNRDRYIFNDLNRRSGAIVFSSSRGGEKSYESREVGNGFFTASILKSLRPDPNDPTDLGVVNFDDLYKKVLETVSDLTGGLQNPTVDRDNIFVKVAVAKPYTARSKAYWKKLPELYKYELVVDGKSIKSDEVQHTYLGGEVLFHGPSNTVYALLSTPNINALDEYQRAVALPKADAYLTTGSRNSRFFEYATLLFDGGIRSSFDDSKVQSITATDTSALILYRPSNKAFFVTKSMVDNARRVIPVSMMDAGKGLWCRTKGYRLIVDGNQIQNETENTWVKDHMLVYHTKSGKTYLFRDYEHRADGIFRPAEVLSSPTGILWYAKDGWGVYEKGKAITKEIDYAFAKNGIDLMITHKTTGRKFLLKNYKNLNDGELHPAELAKE